MKRIDSNKEKNLKRAKIIDKEIAIINDGIKRGMYKGKSLLNAIARRNLKISEYNKTIVGII